MEPYSWRDYSATRMHFLCPVGAGKLIANNFPYQEIYFGSKSGA